MSNSSLSNSPYTITQPFTISSSKYNKQNNLTCSKKLSSQKPIQPFSQNPINNSRQHKHSDYYMYLTTFFKPKSSSTSKKSNDANFSSTIHRFEEYEKSKQTKIKRLRITQSQEQQKEMKDKPSINPKSKRIVKAKGNFLTRNKEYLTKKNEVSIVKDNNTNKEQKIKRKRHISLDLNATINKMYEWENKRLEKIKCKQKENEQRSLINVQSRPIINKKSKKIATKLNKTNNTNSTIKRLYKAEPEKIYQKKILLEHILMPTFTPRIYTCSHYYETQIKKKKFSATTTSSTLFKRSAHFNQSVDNI